MNQAILNLIDEEIKIYKSFTTPIASAYAEVWVMVLEWIRDKISSLPSDTQWIDAIKRVQSLIDIELYDHDWASINTSYLRWLEAALWEIKWEPPERNLIS